MNPKGRATAPSGVVTFLFTDIEGSTRCWEAADPVDLPPNICAKTISRTITVVSKGII
jgi:class 3 adenylate cyclase